MLGISYGELFLLVGATAALIGPKDLPIIARTVGRLAGRAIGYVQLARGQFESVMQQSQARQVHKELQDTLAQLEAIRHEIRTISFMNPGPLTRRLVDNLDQIPAGNVENALERNEKESTSSTRNSEDHSFKTLTSYDVQGQATTNAKLAESSTSKDQSFTRSASSDLHGQATSSAKSADSATSKDQSSIPSASSDLHSQATAYARLTEFKSLKSGSVNNEILSELTDESGQVIVLPVSAETAELLPKRKDDITGSDIVLEAVLEAEVARNAKDFFMQPQNLKM